MKDKIDTKNFFTEIHRYIYIYSKRIQCGKNGEFTGTSAVCYAWFIWQKGFVGEPTIRWIAPKKERYEQMNLFEGETDGNT